MIDYKSEIEFNFPTDDNFTESIYLKPNCTLEDPHDDEYIALSGYQKPVWVKKDYWERRLNYLKENNNG